MLIAYRLVDNGYRIIETFAERTHARIPPFGDVELDLAFLPGTA